MRIPISNIAKGRMEIAAMSFPYRKKKSLGIYDEHTNTWYKVATFNNDESAEHFMEYLARFCGAENQLEKLKEAERKEV